MSKKYPKFSDQAFAREIAVLSKTNPITNKAFESINAGIPPAQVLSSLKRCHLRSGQINMDLSYALFLVSEVEGCPKEVCDEAIDLSVLTADS